MDAILNLRSLLDFILEHKENILTLPLDKRMVFAKTVLSISDNCNAARINLDRGLSIDREIHAMRLLAPSIEAAISMFAKASFAKAISTVFHVNTGIDTFLKTCDADAKIEFRDNLLQLAIAYRGVSEVCISA
jgi:hypothetical protein